MTYREWLAGMAMQGYASNPEAWDKTNEEVACWSVAAADALIESYGLHECYDLLEYYFESAQKPDWKYFSNFAQEIIKSKANKEQDDKERQERRKLARAWLDE
jgi:hypothetical protein